MTADAAQILHGTAVALCARAVLITGASGSGKSALALEMMALGAGLIADDRTRLFPSDGALFAAAPSTLPARIEARGIGLIPVDLHPPAPLMLIVDLDLAPPARLPDPGTRVILGLATPCLAAQGIGAPLAAALVLMLKSNYVPGHD